MKAVILAGGRGSRIAAEYPDIPKPMIPVCGKPVLQHQIETLRKEGVREFILVTGYLGERIEAYFGDGSAFGVHITYYREPLPLGTAGALFSLGLPEDFLLCGGDLIFDFSLRDMVAFHEKNNALATLLAHPNDHPFDSTLIRAEESGRINALISKEETPAACANLCNAGIQLLSPRLLDLYRADGYADLDRDLLRPALATRRLFAYRSYEYVRDMGTPTRLRAVQADIRAGIVAAKHRKNLQRAVFLDRDGTVNVYKGLITDPQALELIPGAAAAIRRMNKAGYLVVIITNQPVIARGDCTLAELRRIHDRLETLLGAQGAYIDGLYFCPHYPEPGFPGEILEYKIKCDCRKPAPGMLLRAAEELHIDLSASYMVGDNPIDAEAGINAGCKPIFLRCGKQCPAPTGVPVFDDLKQFSDTLSAEKRT
ncbi:MAG: HAD-IIIA family hydrolase [Clostridia bacterium]|nr:HAD-IIIA family hydrolase [Clostridia bacterium]